VPRNRLGERKTLTQNEKRIDYTTAPSETSSQLPIRTNFTPLLPSCERLRLEIYEDSTPADYQLLVSAFQKDQNQGLVNALTRMRTVGHCSITGTLGYDVSLVRMIPTPTGRQIRFVTNRQLRFGEVWADPQSTAFNLTAAEFNLNDQEKHRSTGVLYPAAQLAIDQQGKLQFQLRENPWNLVDVIDWKGTRGVN